MSKRVLRFPAKPPPRPDGTIVYDTTIVFDIGGDIGGDRFAIDWSAQIRPLPPKAEVVKIPRRKKGVR